MRKILQICKPSVKNNARIVDHGMEYNGVDEINIIYGNLQHYLRIVNHPDVVISHE